MATRIIVVDETDSTQDEARRHFGYGPVLVVTHHQRRGRGRSGAPWVAAPRAIAASLAWDPGWPTDALPRLALLAGLAATDLVEAGLEWPNDLVVDDGKVGGILAEASGGGVVVGLGLNLWWPDPPERFAALHTTDPGRDAVESTAEAWADRLLVRSGAGPGEWGLDDYLARCRTIGRSITWSPDGRGTALSVADDGALVVDTDAGVVHLRSGAVRDVG